MKLKLIYMTLLFTAISSTSFAKDENVQKKLFNQLITQDKQYIATLKIKNERLFRLTYPTCTDKIHFTRLKPKSLITPIFTVPKTDKNSKKNENKSIENQKPVKIFPSHGQWIEKTIANSCGQAIQLNQLVNAYNTNKMPVIYPLLNGQTYLNAIDQTIAEKAVKKQIKNSSISCHGNIFIKNTGFHGYRSATNNSLSQTNDNAGWFEKWSVEACRTDYTINLAIMPDPNTKYRYIARMER